MKVIELLKISSKLLETMQNCCIKVGDVRYIGLYEDYCNIMEKHHKATYAAAVLSKKYGISERQFFYLIKRFEQDCKICA